nr:hypothetical protein [Planctomycetota bacterium]
MSRIGYALLILLLAVGGAYVFWPQPVGRDAVAIFDGPPPPAFTVRIGQLEQVVSAEGVVVAGWRRPVDVDRAMGLWRLLGEARVDKDHITSAAAGELASYGIDGSRAISAGGVTIRWASAADGGSVWESGRGRLFRVPVQLTKQIDAVVQRLDSTVILEAPEEITRVSTGGTTFTRTAAGWADEAHPERPTATVRVERILQLMERVRLDTFAAAVTDQLPLVAACVVAGSARAITDALAAASAAPSERRVEIRRDGVEGSIT